MKTKLSEVKLNDIIGLNVPYNVTDMMMEITEVNFEQWRKGLLNTYGDFILDIDRNREWYYAVKFECDKFNEERKKYIEQKASWCDKYGCD